MSDALFTYLQHVVQRGGSVMELGAAVRICRAGWSAQLDGETPFGDVDFVKVGNQLFDRIQEAFEGEKDALSKCRLLGLMYEAMTGIGMEWSARKDSAFVNAFLQNADGWQREACREDGLIQALLCKVSAYYLYCQEADTNPAVSGYIDACIERWKEGLNGAAGKTALERIAAMRAVAQMKADAELMVTTGGLLEAEADALLADGKLPLDVLSALHDELEAAGCTKILKVLDLKIETMLENRPDVRSQFVLESLLLASKVAHAGSLSMV